ncbi:MAG: hypothetical protein V8S89_02335 [Oscillospiraceae bacterium]
MWRENLLNPDWGFPFAVSAGCAVGIGNVRRFPFIVGQNGGGLFVLLYLIMLVVLGLPVLTMELAVGRASRKSAVLAYRALEKPGAKWHIHAVVCPPGLLSADDVLYQCLRLDAELLFQIRHRCISAGNRTRRPAGRSFPICSADPWRRWASGWR